MLDVALRGGTLVDGTGSPPRAADVGVQGGRLVPVGSLDGVDAQQTFDIGGLVLAPGTGTRIESAKQTVFHTVDAPSHILLPIIPR